MSGFDTPYYCRGGVWQYKIYKNSQFMKNIYYNKILLPAYYLVILISAQEEYHWPWFNIHRHCKR